MIKITECPRDAMQGIKEFIPTEIKAEYINSLHKVGFHRIDFGSFVSPKAVPQMKDTAEVLSKIKLDNTYTKLLAIVANTRGANDASNFDEISFLGYPFSVSDTFQQKNTNSTIEESITKVEDILKICDESNKTLQIYISMAFGNPYGDDWSPEIVSMWIERLANLGIYEFALADTVGIASEETISSLFKQVIYDYPDINISAHLHSEPGTALKKIEAAYNAGCRYFDSAIKGFGGCPMSDNELVGNISTENLIYFAEKKDELNGFNMGAFLNAASYSEKVF